MTEGSIGVEELNRLKWRSRRGLLECDLLIKRFFEAHGDALNVHQAGAFAELMALDDPDLLDLLLRRTEPKDALDHTDVQDLLKLLRV
jgi:antitoxin CptB